MSYKSQKFLFYIWVVEPATFDLNWWTCLPFDSREFPPTHWAGALRFSCSLEAFETEIVIAIVRSRSLGNLFPADRARVFSPIDEVHDLHLLLLVDRIENQLVLSLLLQELLIL